MCATRYVPPGARLGGGVKCDSNRGGENGGTGSTKVVQDVRRLATIHIAQGESYPTFFTFDCDGRTLAGRLVFHALLE